MKKQSLLFAVFCLFAAMSCKKDWQEAPPSTSLNAQEASSSVVSNSKAGPVGVCYVEANNNNILNTGAYTLKNGGQQLFDLAIVFAANINYDVSTGRTVLYSNNNVTKVLANRDTYIQPLQNKGIKVTLSILGNHQGAGISNFTSRAAARDFAQQLAQTVAVYGLDGIDFDDEYSDYGKNGTGQPNDSSFTMLTEELRALMPDKIISFYFFGPATTRQSYNGKRVGDFVDYSWNASYGTYKMPNVPPLAKSQLGPAATWINNTLAAVATANAARTIADGYGIYMYYDLHGYNESSYLSGPAFAMYGDSAHLSGPLQSWSQGNGPDAPHDLASTNISAGSAMLSWSAVSGVNSYSIDYKPATSSAWMSAASGTTGIAVTVSGLSPNTAYDWRVISHSAAGNSTYSFAQFATTMLQGVQFYANANYTGATTREIPKGEYTLLQLRTFGFEDNWASSVQIPQGWMITMYKNDNFKKTSWLLSASTVDFSLLSPSADDQVTSVKIQ